MEKENFLPIGIQIKLSTHSDPLGRVSWNDAQIHLFFECLKKVYREFQDFLKNEMKLKLVDINPETVHCQVSDFEVGEFVEQCDKGVLENSLKSFLRWKVGSELDLNGVILDIKWILPPDVKPTQLSTATSMKGVADLGGTAFRDQIANKQQSQVVASKERSSISHCDVVQVSSTKQSPFQDGSHCQCLVCWNSSYQNMSFVGDLMNAIFYLVIPDSVGSVDKAWLIVKGDQDKTLMTKHNVEHFVWSAEKQLSKNSEYHYSVQFKDSTLIKFCKTLIPKSLWKGNRFEEDEWRYPYDCFFQKDILSVELENRNISAAYKFFFKEMLEEIVSPYLLDCVKADFDRKHAAVLQRGCIPELAFHLIEAFATDRKQTAYKALFVVLVLAKLYADPSSLQFVGTRVDKKAIQNLLRHLCQTPFLWSDKSLELRVANTIIGLLKNCTEQTCNFFDFVFYCYPTVSISCLLELKSKYCWNTRASDSTIASAVEQLCTFADVTGTTVDDLLQTLNFAPAKFSISAMKTLQKKLSKENQLLQRLRQQMIACFETDIKKCLSFNYLYSLYDCIADFDESLVSELKEAFETTILRLSPTRKTAAQKEEVTHFKCMIRCPHFFESQTHTVSLISLVGESKVPELHSLFPELLVDSKFTKALKNTSSELPELIKTWIISAEAIRNKFGFDQQWYSQINKITESQIFERNKGLLCETENMILDYFAAAAVRFVTCCKNVAQLLDGQHVSEQGSQQNQVFLKISHHLEKFVVEQVKKVPCSWSQEEVKALVHIGQSNLLFAEREMAAEILQALANSKIQSIHEGFLQVLESGKFFKQLDMKEVSEILKQWFEFAKIFHSKEKAKQKLHCSYVEQIYIYEYLVAVCNIPTPPEYDTLKHELKLSVKGELSRLNIGARLELVKSAEKLSAGVVPLLKKHIEDMENETFSQKDLDIHLIV